MISVLLAICIENSRCRHNLRAVKQLSIQCACAALLVRPAAFGFNSQTAATNCLQRGSREPAQRIIDRARAESMLLAQGLREAGVAVCLAEDSAEPAKPDAVFPNNWASWHADGTVVLYPMLAPSRRLERRAEILAEVERFGFVPRRLLDLTGHEAHGRYLEGTGSLVLDHVNRLAYASRSARTDEGVVREWGEAFGYEVEVFDAAGPDGAPVYHTNVLMWIGSYFAGVGTDWIAPRDRGRVLERLAQGGRRVLALDSQALLGFAGNMLELRGRDSGVLVMSECSGTALGEGVLAELADSGLQLLRVPVPTMETIGGGSVRCMIAELPLTSRITP
ncbi:MAG: arginine deiminase-related protein [Steroidobacteraceae bacterium]